jgi:hypothetical protein
MVALGLDEDACAAGVVGVPAAAGVRIDADGGVGVSVDGGVARRCIGISIFFSLVESENPN